MGKSNSTYTIPLKSLSDGVHEYTYHLDDNFFAEIDSPEVQKGEADAVVTVRRTGETFELHVTIEGRISIPCDRCLDDMELPVETDDILYVKFGEEYSEESENLIVVPESEGTIDLAWYIFECIALTIPLMHTHAEGECNPEMAAILQSHSTYVVDDADAAPETDDECIDPRWEALKQLKENK
ncbi:MAG: DUF177 domain-containing protein [Coprobacter sp.]|nr:DUF177 domain-containing protein [Coprobacter sp.]